MVYEIAGLRVQIDNKYEFTTKFCQDYLSQDQTSPVEIIAVATDEEFEQEKKMAEQNFSDGYIENICLYRSICMQMPAFGRMLLHCSVLEYDGIAYAFLGRSGTGKSTHTKLWLKYLSPTRVINGDKPILEYREGEFIAYGTPWMGKERWGTKAKAPLKGLCFLEQAKTNAIRKLSVSETSSRLFTQILIPNEEANAIATLDITDKLVSTVPAYLLQCDISEEAVEKSFEMMTGYAFNEKKNKFD
jgi:hypothetical protein